MIGVISDTHGWLDECVLELFADVSRILHAGDVGSDDVLLRLEALAPVTAVRGNTDHYPGAQKLPDVARLEHEGLRIAMVHDGSRWLREHGDDAAGGFAVLICGHTHVAGAETGEGYLRLNPGSASRPVHGRVPSVALLEAVGGRPRARIVPLREEGHG